MANSNRAMTSPIKSYTKPEYDQKRFQQMHMKDFNFNEPLKTIGTGGFGEVKLVPHKRLGDFAIKFFEEKKVPDRTEQKMWKEAAIMREASGPRIVAVYALLDCSTMKAQLGYCYGLVMEFVQYGSIDVFIEHVKSNLNMDVPWSIIFQMDMEMWQGIAILHEKKIVHGDIKSQNILVDGDLHIKITDFGMSSLKIMTSTYSVNTGKIKGTPAHLAYEVITGNAGKTFKSDVYSAAVTTFELITGGLPYPNLSPDVIEWRRKQCIPPNVTLIPATTHLLLTHVFSMGISTDPEERPDAAQIWQTLDKEYKENVESIVMGEKNWLLSALSAIEREETIPGKAYHTPQPSQMGNEIKQEYLQELRAYMNNSSATQNQDKIASQLEAQNDMPGSITTPINEPNVPYMNNKQIDGVPATVPEFVDENDFQSTATQSGQQPPPKRTDNWSTEAQLDEDVGASLVSTPEQSQQMLETNVQSESELFSQTQSLFLLNIVAQSPQSGEEHTISERMSLNVPPMNEQGAGTTDFNLTMANENRDGQVNTGASFNLDSDEQPTIKSIGSRNNGAGTSAQQPVRTGARHQSEPSIQTSKPSFMARFRRSLRRQKSSEQRSSQDSMGCKLKKFNGHNYRKTPCGISIQGERRDELVIKPIKGSEIVFPLAGSSMTCNKECLEAHGRVGDLKLKFQNKQGAESWVRKLSYAASGGSQTTRHSQNGSRQNGKEKSSTSSTDRVPDYSPQEPPTDGLGLSVSPNNNHDSVSSTTYVKQPYETPGMLQLSSSDGRQMTLPTAQTADMTDQATGMSKSLPVTVNNKTESPKEKDISRQDQGTQMSRVMYASLPNTSQSNPANADEELRGPMLRVNGEERIPGLNDGHRQENEKKQTAVPEDRTLTDHGIEKARFFPPPSLPPNQDAYGMHGVDGMCATENGTDQPGQSTSHQPAGLQPSAASGQQVPQTIIHFHIHNNPATSSAGGGDGDDLEHVSVENPIPPVQFIPALESTRKANDEDKELVLKHIVSNNWKQIARKLNLQEGEIDALYIDHKDLGFDEVKYQMLRKWTEKNGRKATVGALAKALVDVGLAHVAAQLNC